MDADATRVGSTINMEKTKVTRINAKNQELIMIAGQGVTGVDEFIWELQFLRREVVWKIWKNRISKRVLKEKNQRNKSIW